MKRVFLFTVAALFSFSSWAQDGTPYMTKTFNGVNNLKANTSGGNIDVTGVEGTQTKVEVFIKSGYNGRQLSNDEIAAKLAEYELVIEQDGTKLILQARQKRNNWRDGLSISFKVTMPKNAATHLRTSGGNINLKNLTGTQDFTTSGGNLDLTDLKGNIDGNTSGGNITAVRVSDQVDLTTSGGNVSVSSSSGNLSLSTSGGNLNLQDLSGTIEATTSGGTVRGERLSGDVEASTSGGNVVMQQISGSLIAGTSGGTVRVSMDKVDKFVKLSNTGGRIDLDLPEGKGYTLDMRGDKIQTSTLRNFSGSSSEGRMNGTVNGGGSQIYVTNSGNINLSFH